MSIEDQLKVLEKDPAFRKRVNAARNAAIQSGKSFGQWNGAGGVVGSPAETKKYLDEILRRIDSAVRTRFPNMASNIFNVSGPTTTKDGFYEYLVIFDPSAVHRDSLYRAGYPEGLENVVALYSHGSNPTKNPVWENLAGTTRRFIPAGWQARPDAFLRSCIDTLNSEFTDKNIRVILDAKYYP